MNNNPLRALVEDGQSIQGALAEDALNMTLAIEQRHLALQAHKSARATYDAAEAEFLFDLTFNNDEYRAAKNKEARDIVQDRALVVARDGGFLAQPWHILSECQLGLENAQMAYDQAEARFKAVRVCAELQAAMLVAMTADVRFMQG